MIKKFEEFVNEGIISDYKKQKEAANKEISSGDKNFVVDLLGKLDEIEFPFVFTCKNYNITSQGVNDDVKDYIKDELKRESDVISMDDIAEMDIKDIHITENSTLVLFEKDSDYVAGDYKNVHSSLYNWFDKKYEKMGITFSGKLSVKRLLEMKNDIKNDVF